jgi:hypothetical protein
LCLEVPWAPEIDQNQLHFFSTQTAIGEDRPVSATPKDLKEVSLASPKMQNDVGTTVISPLQSAAEENTVDSSRPRADTRKVPRIAQHSTPQAISRGIKRHSACLDVVLEADDEEGLDEARNAVDLTDGVDLQNRLKVQLREQVAKNRASFWDTLSDEQSHSPQHSLDIKDALGLSPPRPHKLRKSKSFALVDRIASSISILRKERIKNKLIERVQIDSSPVMTSPQGSPALDLPTGIVQTGQGIGFNYALVPATLSKASICSITPRTCHGLSLKGFSRLARKTKASIDQQGLTSPVHSENDEDREMMAVMKEIYGSTWSLGMSAVNVAQPLAYPTVNSPLSTLSPGLQPSETPEFAEADEAIVGDPDTTLRLVPPSRD